MEEPKRKSLLDVLNEHLCLADRFALVTRFMYIGVYNGSKEDVQNVIEMNVKELNAEYGETVLTGLLLIYPNYFLHLIEASEETIYKHLKCILSDEFKEIFGRLICLPTYNNIYKMYFFEWYDTYVKTPPVLLNKIENTETEEIHKQLKNCLFKMYSLCEYLMDAKNHSLYKFQETIKNLDEHVPDRLPEATVVEYLLSMESLILEDLRQYFKMCNEIPIIHNYNDIIWPAHGNFIPHLINDTELTETEEDR